MRLLLHICCAPCATATVEAWRKDGADLAGIFFNPNIHPFGEHQLRYQALARYAGEIGLPLLGEPRYDVVAWLRQVSGHEEEGVRCRICIHQRLRHTAGLAAATGRDAFSTTLSISPWQNHRIIREEGERAAAETGVAFYYRDLRDEYRLSRRMSREAGLYRQKYCGCIYSEAEAAFRRMRRSAQRNRPS